MACPLDKGAGGVQRVFQELIRWLEAEQRRVHVVCQAAFPQIRSTETVAWGRRALACPMPGVLGNSMLLTLAVFIVYLPISVFHLLRLFRRHQIDVVNCHYLTEYFVHLVVAARLAGIPVLISVHGADVDRYVTSSPAQRLLLRLVIRGAAGVVACSEAMARDTVAVFPAARGKVTHVHNGLDLADFGDPKEASAISGPFVLSICRQVEKKGVDTLLRAFALLGRDFPHLTLVVVGGGRELEKNQALARSLGIDERVAFLGRMEHARVVPYLAECALVVVPSRAEPFGLVVLEAACYRKGIVATRVGGIPEIVADEVSALLVEANDPAAMAARMARLLRDPDLSGRLGERAHQILTSRFLWQHRVHDYIAAYEGAGAPVDDAALSGSSPGATTAARR
jgi:glycosyltransferase involved in cell wall biosynthesis